MPDDESQTKVKSGLTLTYDTLIDLVAAHRPYGMDCACGQPINSDRDWARHLAHMLQLTQEWGAAVVDPSAPVPYFNPTDQLSEAKFAAAGLEGGYVVSRLVGPWRVVTDD